jgi:hypothetical protein
LGDHDRGLGHCDGGAIANVALPTIATDLNASSFFSIWIVNGFTASTQSRAQSWHERMLPVQNRASREMDKSPQRHILDVKFGGKFGES